jgi:hypothetical protein
MIMALGVTITYYLRQKWIFGVRNKEAVDFQLFKELFDWILCDKLILH